MKWAVFLVLIKLTFVAQLMAQQRPPLGKQQVDKVILYTEARLRQAGITFTSIERMVSLNPMIYMSQYVPAGIIYGGLESDGIVKRGYLIKINFEDGSSVQCSSWIGTAAWLGQSSLPKNFVSVQVENCGDTGEKLANVGFIPEQL